MDAGDRAGPAVHRLEFQTMTEERIARRLTTVFAADVAGFSRLSAEDEEGTLRMWVEQTWHGASPS
jgi:class 3 adenylate cyclase